MANLSLIKPLDQPTGARRLLNELRDALADANFNTFRLVVAFAKSGPLLRLQSTLEDRRKRGHRSEAIIGIDQQGTSRQALELSLKLFNSVHVTQERSITFHPKIYVFAGPTQARCFIGSNNLTVGGTETNFETAVRIDLALPAEQAMLQPFLDAWASLLPPVCPATTALDTAALTKLLTERRVIDEVATWSKGGSGAPGTGPTSAPPRSSLALKPPSALPPGLMKSAVKPSSASKKAATKKVSGTHPIVSSVPAQGFAIQIKPHHNGEIFLSVTAALQNPAFFHWPFTGLTIPKKAGNPSYPQLDPDPRVNITVYGAGLATVLSLNNYGLNTVYYETKSEIRITASPLVGVVPDYSVMIMRRSDTLSIDYDVTIHRPDSPEYGDWLAACNQTMPGGGRAPRKFGWF